MSRWISRQRKLPIRKEKLMTEDKDEFYTYFRNILQQINTVFEAVYNALNFPQAIAFFQKTSSQTAESEDSWEDIVWDREEILYDRIRLADDDKTYILKTGGHFLVTYSVSFRNDKGSSMRANLRLRATVNGNELRQSQYFTYIEKDSGELVTTGTITALARLHRDDELKFQFNVEDTDLIIDYANTHFDNNRSADMQIIQLEYR